MLILSPLSIVDNVWPDQIATYAVRKDLRVIPLGTRYSSVKAKLEKAQNLLAAHQVPAVLILNFESCWRSPLAPWLLRQPWDFLIVDESHRLKTPAGRASVYVSNLADLVPKRILLSGTPMPHSPLDIYAQYRILDKTVYGTNYQGFKDRYAITSEIHVKRPIPEGQPVDPDNPPQPQYDVRHPVTDFQNLDELENLFYTRAFRVTADQALDLPPVLNTYFRVPLGPKALKIYRQMETKFVADLGNGQTLTAPNALAQLLRLQQITSGYVPSKDAEELQVDNAKTQALNDLLTDIPQKEPVVVFARFHHDLDEIIKTAQASNRPAFELSGRRKEIQEWQEQGGVLAVQIQTGGLGISLTNARYCIYYSLGFNLGDYLQSLARLHRPGQTHTVQYIHLIAEDTVDVTVIRSLARKQDVVASILQHRSIDTKTMPEQDAPEQDAPEQDAPEQDAPEQDAPETKSGAHQPAGRPTVLDHQTAGRRTAARRQSTPTRSEHPVNRNEIVHEYIKLTKQKRSLETQLNAVKNSLTNIESMVIDYFTTEGIQNLKTTDGTAYLSMSVHASLLADENGEFEGAFAALKEANLDYLIKQGVNSQSLSGYVRQQRKMEEPIPPGVVPFIRIHEQPRIGVNS